MVGAVRTPGSLRHAGVALTVAVLAAGLLAPGSVLAAKKERVAVSIPDEGQLAAARLGFKVKGTAKPKVKVKLANADELHPDIVIAAQVAREKSKRGKKKKGKKRKKKGRAAVLLAIGNVPGAAASGRDRRVTVTGGERAIVEVASANQAISSLRFDDLPTSSRTFLSVLGAEPAGERQLAQDTFDIDYEDFEEIPYTTDGLELLDLMTAMGLSRVNDAEVITSDTVAGLFPDRAIAAAIAAALGPPATLDAKTYNVLSGRPFPLTLTYQHVPASNPGVLFNFAGYSAPVAGAQVSVADEYPLSTGMEARCANGNAEFGTVIRLGGEDVACRLPAFDRDLFFDIPFQNPPPENVMLGRLMPIPAYPGSSPGGELGEALTGPGVSVPIRRTQF